MPMWPSTNPFLPSSRPSLWVLLLASPFAFVSAPRVASAQPAPDAAAPSAPAPAPPAASESEADADEQAGAETEAPAGPTTAAEADATAAATAEAADAGAGATSDPAGERPAGAAVEALPAGAHAEAVGPIESSATVTETRTQDAPERLARDELKGAGYVPGYRHHVALGASPYAPRQGALAGGMTPGYRAPMPGEDWTFKFAGYVTMSAQYSVDQRKYPADGQSKTVLHVPPQTVETYGYFTSTSTIPGNWADLRFSYGNSLVTSNISINTWNPTRPTTYYGLGSQYFINDAFLDFTPAALGPVKIAFRVGRFGRTYGALGQYGNGIYQHAITGGPQSAIGELFMGDIALSSKVELNIEHGLMGSRDGTIPDNVIASPQIGWQRPLWTGSFIHHAHLGFTVRGAAQVKLQAHYLTDWSQEDRNDAPYDNPTTQQADESNVRDGRLTVAGADVRIHHDAFGFLGAGVAYLRGTNYYPLRGIMTYGGTGEDLTNRYWGAPSEGNGELLIAGVNYEFSIGKFVNYPRSFGGDGPDIKINTGAHLVRVYSDYEPYDGKLRSKFGADVLYTFHRFMGAAVRVDRVSPNSFDSGETFSVLAPRLVFKTDWNTHEQIQLMYAKWFYGDRTRNEGTGLRTPERLDDQMVALNFNMWW
jgi:hypothetical protein